MWVIILVVVLLPFVPLTEISFRRGLAGSTLLVGDPQRCRTLCLTDSAHDTLQQAVAGLIGQAQRPLGDQVGLLGIGPRIGHYPVAGLARLVDGYRGADAQRAAVQLANPCGELGDGRRSGGSTARARPA